MQFAVKMPENSRKIIFRDKQTTNKVPQMFLDVKIAYGKEINTFFDCANKQGRYSVCIYRLKASKK